LRFIDKLKIIIIIKKKNKKPDLQGKKMVVARGTTRTGAARNLSEKTSKRCMRGEKVPKHYRSDSQASKTP